MSRNILQLIDSFQQGGTERQVVQLTRGLIESGRYNVHLACLSAEGPLRSEIERLELGTIPVFPLNNFYDRNMTRQVRRLASYLREHQIDLLHTHDFYCNIFGIASGLLARTPVRIVSRRETEGIRTRAQRTIERLAFHGAHAIVTNAEAIRVGLINEGFRPDRLFTIHNGVDTTRLTADSNLTRAEALRVCGLPDNLAGRLITIVANMRHPEKDQSTFLRAAARVRKQFCDTAFILAGEGEQLASLREVADSLGLANQAYFIGRCAHVAELLSLSEICVLSSRGVEGFSNSILEYMAAARPVVATDIGGAREAISEGETGFVVPIGDDEMMATRIVELLTEPEIGAAMGLRGLERVRELFSCEGQLQRTERLYKQLLADESHACALVGEFQTKQPTPDCKKSERPR